jgi:hypothetical protein
VIKICISNVGWVKIWTVCRGQLAARRIEFSRNFFSRRLSGSVCPRFFLVSTYISNNRAFIPNYADRYRYDEIISTAFAESAINEVVSKRMVKKQQMRWSKKGTHLLLQVRVKTLNDDLHSTFEEWYPGMKCKSGYATEMSMAV